MFQHRFREQLAQPSLVSTFAGAAAGCAFVPCPVFGLFAPAQLSQIQEVYRIAAERTRDQLRRQWARRPQFSLN